MLLFLLYHQIIWGVIQLGWVLIMLVILHMMKYWRLYVEVNNYININWFWNERLKVLMMIMNVMMNNSSAWHNCLWLITNILKSFVNIILINTHVNYNLQFNIFPFFWYFYFAFASHYPPGFPMQRYWNIWHSHS